MIDSTEIEFGKKCVHCGRTGRIKCVKTVRPSSHKDANGIYKSIYEFNDICTFCRMFQDHKTKKKEK